MISVLLSLFLFAEPFWTATPPNQWSDAELSQLFNDSPWGQSIGGAGPNAPGVEVYLATAAPMQTAEKEAERRAALRRKPGELPPENSEYRVWLEDNRTTQIVLAVQIQANKGFLEDRELQRMEQETRLRAGKKKIKLTGSFPPTQNDPYLRLAFPRDGIQLSDKNLEFDLYLPGVPSPYRTAEFRLKDMVLNGKLEM